MLLCKSYIAETGDILASLYSQGRHRRGEEVKISATKRKRKRKGRSASATMDDDIIKVLQQLGDCMVDDIKSSWDNQTPSDAAGDEQVEARVRALIPNLLQTYFQPSAVLKVGRERERAAILQLLCRTTHRFPGTFYYGRAQGIMPLLGWIIPFFADPEFASQHDLLHETMTALLLLLSTGDCLAYRWFLLDAMILAEDLLSVASFYATESSFTISTALSLICFRNSFLEVYKDDISSPFASLPSWSQPPDGPGILIDLTGETRWQSFAYWIVNLLSKCVAETRLQVEGLVSSSFVSVTCSFLAYGNSALQRACFDFIHVVSSLLDVEIIPVETILHSISSILSYGAENDIHFRTKAYDSAMGRCLNALYSVCPKHIVEYTSHKLLTVLGQTFQNTSSEELKAAVCYAYACVVSTCPPQYWQLDSLFSMLLCSEPCNQLISCFQQVVDRLGSEIVVGQIKTHGSESGTSSDRKIENNDFSMRMKRTRENCTDIQVKRIKTIHDDFLQLKNENYSGDLCPNMLIQTAHANHEQYKRDYYAAYLHDLIDGTLNSLEQSDDLQSARRHLFTVLSILCQVFSKYPKTPCFMCISKHIFAMLPWISEQCREGTLKIMQFSLFLDSLDRILLLQSFAPDVELRRNEENLNLEALMLIIKIPWSVTLYMNHIDLMEKTKCRAVSILYKIGDIAAEKSIAMLDFALQDADAIVRAEAASSFPLLALNSGQDMIIAICKRLETLGHEKSEVVRETVSYCIGCMICIFSCLLENENTTDNLCQVFQKSLPDMDLKIKDILLSGFYCPRCDSKHNEELECFAIEMTSCQFLKIGSCEGGSTIMNVLNSCYSLFSELVFDESSEKVQVAAISSISRLLCHAANSGQANMKSVWMKCLEILPVSEKKAVRRAFSLQIPYFIDKNMMEYLFDEGREGKLKEEKVLGILKHALASADDSDVVETLLETVSQVMKVADVNGYLFFFSFALLIDQLDCPKVWLRVKASRLINAAAAFQQKGGVRTILSKYHGVRDELYEYLKSKLVNRPHIISEFAEAVLDVPVRNLLQQMLPVVLPKLVISQQKSSHAMATLQELAKQLNKKLPVLLLEWCHKVLSYVLLHSDAKELIAVMKFYEAQTGSDTREIFTAVLPVLLEELVHLMGYAGNDNTEERSRLLRIPEMIQEVSLLVTGTKDLPSFLRNYFVGLLNCIDTKMLRVDDQSLQNQALRCLEKLIEMIGPHLSAFVPKIMVLLMYAIEKECLQLKGLHVLHLFIQRLAQVSPLSLKHVIQQIVAVLMPFLEREQNENSETSKMLVEIFEQLILNNKELLEEQLVDLPMLPNIPRLDRVNEILGTAHRFLSLREKLQKSVDGLTHVSLSVRYTSALGLTKLLRANKEHVNAMILAGVVSDANVISLLITSLLRGCAEETRTIVGQKLKLVCAECLGDIGAVDPLKFQVNTCQRFKIECSDDDLIFELIHEHLARVFRAASDTIVQDAAALAIQELLKHSGCQASVDDTVTKGHKKSLCDVTQHDRGEKLWSRFSDYIKDIIAPCLTSKFHLQNVAFSTSTGAIYRPSMSFRRWMYSWIKKLTSQAQGTRANIFNACRGIVRHDMGTALYLLPYLVLNVVCYGTTDAREGVTEEILAVLAEAVVDSKVEAVTVSQGVPHSGVDCGASGQNELCIQAIFTLLDNLGQWVDDLKQKLVLSQSQGSASSKLLQTKHNDEPQVEVDQIAVQCDNVSELLSAVPKVTLAEASFKCQAYARSLLYFETHVRSKSGSFNPAAFSNGVFEDSDVSFLMEIYSGLDEPDGLFGLARLRTTASLQDQILINEKAGNWAEALACSEQALQMEPTSIQRHSEILNCLLNMCHLQAMVTHVDGLVARFPQHKKEWCMRGVQAAWRLGRWELMNEYLSFADKEGVGSNSTEYSSSFDINLAKCLQAWKKKDDFSFKENITYTRHALLAPLAAAGMESYTRAYPFVVKLHMLKELEEFYVLSIENLMRSVSDVNSPNPNLENMIKQWDDRLKFTQPSLWAWEPILALRRLILSDINHHSEASSCWFQYAKLCRASGHYETASRAILQAQSSEAANMHMEFAKLNWEAGKSERAIAELQRALADIPTEDLGVAAEAVRSDLLFIPPSSQPVILATQARRNKSSDTAKTLLLFARWVHHTGKKQKEDVISLYVRVKELLPAWEKSYFFMAKYHDDLVADVRKRQEENTEGKPPTDEKPWWSSLSEVLLLYAKGLHKGHSRLYQALPRLLTLWFQFGSMFTEVANPSSDLKRAHNKVMSVMRGCLKDLPTYQWFTALSQLLSRICHQNEEVVQLVKQIVIAVLQTYPQQGLWKMAAVSRSAVTTRRQATAEIIQAARRAVRNENIENDIFVQFSNLIDHLIKLCFRGVEARARTLNISSDFSALKRMMPVGVIMPVQEALTVSLPATCISDKTHNPFSSGTYATISGIADEVEVLQSLQHPKKIILHGSDGSVRPFLCKPKDDLRKDARMMEFTTMINLLLSKDPKSRRRKLYIRTFAVIPFKEDCGMVEWVLHTRGLRHILQDLYISVGKFDKQKTNGTIKQIYDAHEKSRQEVEMFKTKILPMFPPIFHKWFMNTFSEPASWFRARVAYARTTAVWSMVGHIVGLGDRHGENILFDSTTGDCVHVDFSCLFDKGLQLQKPELVPFRLTQNMVDGLGITGYEGIYLRVCEMTLSVLRTHRETLMSVLEAFIHDPLLEWTKSNTYSGEIHNPLAQRAISNIEARLRGVVVGVGAAPSLPLSVEGQARRLIAEAVSHENLAKMYIWWMPWF